MDEIRDVGGRDHIPRGFDGLPTREGVEGAPDEVVAVPGAEQGAGAHDEGRVVGGEDEARGYGLAGTLHSGGIARIAFDIRPSEALVEDEILPVRHERNASRGTGAGEVLRPQSIAAEAGFR